MEVQELDDYFGYTEKGSSLDAELRAGLTTFLTMAYILIVNPSMLSNFGATGIPFDDALFATAIAAFVGCVVMGLWANLPFALAPGMGLNAYFTFAVVLGMGIPWDVALAAVFVEGIIFLIISLPAVGWRTQMINSIPTDLKIATGAGIGMFLAIIGLREMGWIRDDGATLVNIAETEKFGLDHGALIAMICLLLTVVLMARGQKGAIIIGIAIASLWGWVTEAYDPYNDFAAGGAGWASTNADWPSAAFGFVGLPDETLFAATSALGDVGGDGVTVGAFLMVMITFLFVDIFDTAGTLYSVGRQAGYVDENDELHNSDEAFMSDAAATIVGAICGTSTTTTYIESVAGVEDGGKTGLVAVTVGVLMLSGLFFSDLFQAIPTFAAALALVVIGAMMMRQAADIDWGDAEMAVPAFLTMVLMPFTYSIADGIAWGVISYCAIKIGMQKWDELNPVMWALFVLMTMFYLGPGDTNTFDWIFDLIGLS
ncbi:MAG: NCS2 family permease [Candidatus Thalassarchaeaceae archaeon]|jgi:AGZA family xanthine/uracil permease-like MFS transporter|nr:guanine permease [Euryarchaeota archaeon]MDP6220692.1 NCS2 family permease [Candidatus Thalassarchaeaceae archaeon]MBV43240.1 guanine permease [Euryarchaeota archaeon]MDP7091311.1 NCS2 family permease [Candidatus Thalassarchaeaceae archaeon]MDP7257547.1 NCS2 family permease [Candidatus Thalassarchaeaceae archaeon]|tara:strand:+ start:1578 stop:3032 length:1455 start_codon:yes stop_codon:yes gene_type:complete